MPPLKITSVSLHYDELGDPDGVTLLAGTKKLYVDLMDASGGAFLSWEEAQKFNLPTVQNALMVLANIQDVNAKLIEAGGTPLIGSYFTNKLYGSDVQIFGYGEGDVPYTYPMLKHSKVMHTKFKVRIIKEL